MKKKFIAVSVLICALALGSTTLTSCVDDNESASVTAIRDAKAKQLTALANYKDVQAQNEKIIAEAKAAIKNAEAKAKEIANELQNIELEKAKATLAIDIETAKTQAEAALLAQQAALESAKASLIRALDQVSIAEKDRINSLIYKADSELSRINDYQQRIITAEQNRISATYELENAKILKEQAISDNNKDIALLEAKLELYKSYENTGIEEAEAAYNESVVAQEKLYADYQTAKKNVYPLKEEGDKLKENLSHSLLMQMQRKPEFSQYIVEDTENTPESEKIIITYDDGTASIQTKNYPESKYKIDSEEVASVVDKNITATNREVAIKQVALQEANTALTAKKAEEGYKLAVKAVADAQDAFNAAKTEAEKEAAKATLEQAERDLVAYTENEEEAVTTAEENLKREQDNLAYYQEIKNWLDNSGYEEYEKIYDSYVKAIDAWWDAYILQDKAWHNYGVQVNKTLILEGILNSTIDFSQDITNCQTTINNLKAQNEDLSSVQSQETLIKYYENQKAQYEEYLKIAQANYDSYIELINDLIENGSTLPETPEEGGEETPAE